jgi:hypothetical protein
LGDPETQKQTVEMRFNGAARHIELAGDLFVVATLEQQFRNLPFPRSEVDLGFFHWRPLSGRDLPATSVKFWRLPALRSAGVAGVHILHVLYLLGPESSRNRYQGQYLPDT